MASLEASEQLSRYWQEQITTWEQSGQSQKAFCEQHELNYHRFGYWRRKFIEQQKPELEFRSKLAIQPAFVRLIPIIATAHLPCFILY